MLVDDTNYLHRIVVTERSVCDRCNIVMVNKQELLTVRDRFAALGSEE